MMDDNKRYDSDWRKKKNNKKKKERDSLFVRKKNNRKRCVDRGTMFAVCSLYSLGTVYPSKMQKFKMHNVRGAVPLNMIGWFCRQPKKKGTKTNVDLFFSPQFSCVRQLLLPEP